MSSSATNQKCLSSETEHMDAAQQMKLRERQRFFEEVFQHDVDVYLSSAHLQIDYKRPPIGSISSMEVNVDMLEQMELLDLSDQETLDVFFSAGPDDDVLTSPLPGKIYEESFEPRSEDSEKSRMSSTSSVNSSDSQGINEEGSETPTVQSDDEDILNDSFTPPPKDESSGPPIFSH
ncbi:dysbindin-like [Denticeps clupeoides]|uniref:dysbindin-like n=1 Tax=Denticeps clupeoides TaxID=299321 RepID=UPI0010A30309|nr:dysbindin-like [Denticeps clupeoides]